jgi:hypothetical protein
MPFQRGELLLQTVDADPDDITGLLREAVPDVLRDPGRPVPAAVIIGQA